MPRGVNITTIYFNYYPLRYDVDGTSDEGGDTRLTGITRRFQKFVKTGNDETVHRVLQGDGDAFWVINLYASHWVCMCFDATRQMAYYIDVMGQYATAPMRSHVVGAMEKVKRHGGLNWRHHGFGRVKGDLHLIGNDVFGDPIQTDGWNCGVWAIFLEIMFARYRREANRSVLTFGQYLHGSDVWKMSRAERDAFIVQQRQTYREAAIKHNGTNPRDCFNPANLDMMASLKVESAKLIAGHPSTQAEPLGPPCSRCDGHHMSQDCRLFKFPRSVGRTQPDSDCAVVQPSVLMGAPAVRFEGVALQKVRHCKSSNFHM